MATAGALVGASIAGLAYKLSGQNYILTFALATIPATIALVITCTVRLLGAGHILGVGCIRHCLLSNMMALCHPCTMRKQEVPLITACVLQAFGDMAKSAGAAKKRAKGACCKSQSII